MCLDKKAIVFDSFFYSYEQKTNEILAKAEFSEEIQKKISCKKGMS